MCGILGNQFRKLNREPKVENAIPTLSKKLSRFCFSESIIMAFSEKEGFGSNVFSTLDKEPVLSISKFEDNKISRFSLAIGNLDFLPTLYHIVKLHP